MVAPEINVTLSSAENVPLKSLYQDGRLALVFLRHFGCTFCREHVAQLRRLPDLNIAFVTLGSAEQTETFRKQMKSPHRFISDPGKVLHGHFNLGRGGLAEVINPHTIVRTIGTMLKGMMMSRPVGDPLQLPGVFIIEPDGSVLWEQRGRDIADTARCDEIEQRLRYSES